MRLTEAQIPWDPDRHHRSTSEVWNPGNPTPCEAAVWILLRQSRIGFNFRQHALAYGWILHNWCPSTGLCVEIDGPTVHDAAADAHRDEELAAYGITTLRFTNPEVLRDVCACVAVIVATAERLNGRKAMGASSL